jgi:hypothetical protein
VGDRAPGQDTLDQHRAAMHGQAGITVGLSVTETSEYER